MLPAAGAMPFVTMLADRFRRERVLLAVYLAKFALVAGVGVLVLADAPTAAVFALAAVAAIASAAQRPTLLALLPLLARTPRELVAANVSSSTIEGLGVFVGPAIAGALLAVADPQAVFWTCAGAFVLAAVLISAARTDAPVRAEGGEAPLDGLLAGLRTLRAQSEPRLVIGLFGTQTLVRGILNVLLVVAAIELLGLGESGVGWLNSAYGIGGLLGALAALSLVGRARLGRPFAFALVLWGAPLALVGIAPEAAVGIAALAVVGAGNAALDVAGFTLVQRLVDDRVLGRVFGVFEMLVFTTVGIGAVAAPLLVAAAGERGALIVAGAILPLAAVAALRRLDRVDDTAEVPVRELEVLRRVRLFQALNAPQIERLARRIEPMHADRGEAIVREGEPGDRFYVIAAGEVEVSANGTFLRALGAGDCFGEIALLHNIPRTATVTARTHVDLYALDRPGFAEALSQNVRTAETAAELIRARLERSAVEREPH
jgi:MFS family permease